MLFIVIQRRSAEIKKPANADAKSCRLDYGSTIELGCYDYDGWGEGSQLSTIITRCVSEGLRSLAHTSRYEKTTLLCERRLDLFFHRVSALQSAAQWARG
jgi:hypothetical protein